MGRYFFEEHFIKNYEELQNGVKKTGYDIFILYKIVVKKSFYVFPEHKIIA